VTYLSLGKGKCIAAFNSYTTPAINCINHRYSMIQVNDLFCDIHRQFND